jgi:hypothetical protein
MTDQLSHKLAQGWTTIHSESGAAIDWIQRVRGNARSVDNEADSLVLKLRRVRNQAKSLAVASSLPSTVGFFGLSQAGKSYLISALAAGADGGPGFDRAQLAGAGMALGSISGFEVVDMGGGDAGVSGIFRTGQLTIAGGQLVGAPGSLVEAKRIVGDILASDAQNFSGLSMDCL